VVQDINPSLATPGWYTEPDDKQELIWDML